MTIDFTPKWQANLAPQKPGPGEVHLWSLPLTISESLESQLRQVLSEDETTRADRFLADEHRRRFIACRARVRLILGRYLNRDPAEIRFQYSGLGKPSLSVEENTPLAFNVTHSSDLALMAVGADGELGADVERQRDIRDMQGLAERFFSREESTGLFQLNRDAQPEAFFRIWTRKEAILKATGKGLTFPLDQLTVSFGPDDPPALVALGDDPAEASQWTLHHLIPQPDYIAAIATRYPLGEIHYWLWRDDLA